MTAEAEALAGKLMAPAVEQRYGGVIRDADAEQRMQRIGSCLCQHTDALKGRYQYRLLGMDTLNALSLPGGRIYITQGLYRRLQSDELVAAVLAHEMSHIVSKDHFKPRCSCPGEAIEREIDADRGGAEFLRRAGIEPEAMIDAVRIIADVQPPGWSDTRVQFLQHSVRQPDEQLASVQN